ncbi:MAG: response regulator transcription factor [Alphaproteobacteria bacterium]|nr:response regulator transcription factor [Alphaproteobacteria bacterium]MDP6815230.1 response regulator transcription factor [Alphaproteobacteria bacterium]
MADPWPLGRQAAVIVVDDDTVLLARLKTALEGAGCLCFAAESAEQMDATLAVRAIDAIVLDVGLPDADGFEVMHRLGESHPDIAILMLTGRGEIEDRLTGLQGGADDYITKPFDTRELLARLNAVLRRKADAPNSGNGEIPATIGGLTLDAVSRRLAGPDGVEVQLTGKEFDLLIAFARNPDKVLTRDWLQFAVNQRPWSPNDRSIDILVGRLRKKLRQAPPLQDALVSERMLGYRLSAPVTFG